MLRMLRVVRVVRVIRIVRLARFFKELRLMMYSILGGVQSLLWVILVFTLIFYTFGIVFTWSAFDYLTFEDRWEDSDRADTVMFFGSIDKSMLSLFMGMTGGVDWIELYEAFDDLWLAQGLLLLYIAFAFFAAINVVTGVFVESAMRTSETDREYIIQEEMAAKELYVKKMQQLFEEMDTNGLGTISLDEFEAHLGDERAIAYLNALKIDFSEARTLFSLLDIDQSGHIDFQEFLAGCDKLSGEARSMDLAMLHYEVRWLTRSFLNFEEFVQSKAIGRALVEHLDVLERSGVVRHLPAWVKANRCSEISKQPTCDANPTA